MVQRIDATNLTTKQFVEEMKRLKKKYKHVYPKTKARKHYIVYY